jgi:TatD DNase family protein
MYSGVYNGSVKHEPDLSSVLARAWSVGVEKIIVTAGNLAEAKTAAELCKSGMNDSRPERRYARSEDAAASAASTMR